MTGGKSVVTWDEEFTERYARGTFRGDGNVGSLSNSALKMSRFGCMWSMYL